MAPLMPTENSRTSLGQIVLPVFFISSSPEETFTLGMRLASLLEKGSIVALSGPLGAGKTCFTKGIAAEIGVKEELTSPTYTIVSEYEGSRHFYHIDVYRLRGDDDFAAIGGEEIVFGDGISVIEWSERIPAFIPPDAFKVDIEIIEDGKRRIRFYREDMSNMESEK